MGQRIALQRPAVPRGDPHQLPGLLPVLGGRRTRIRGGGGGGGAAPPPPPAAGGGRGGPPPPQPRAPPPAAPANSTPSTSRFSAGGGRGCGAGPAAGAQRGAPGRPVVCVIGDGSIHYAVQALWTAAAYRVPVTFVVLSNAKYAILHWFAQLEHAQGSPGLDIPGLDITAVADGYGVRAHRAQGAGELTKLVRDATARQDGPVLIDVPVTTELPSL
ncbi:thiamine pyrophosphate-dependent enzyme [Streptomyces vinaceus]|uniref:thiamine pyrophosphate-dependent enzyme n=1 Tax=Streptomyces vinaceus TaxID=1960 RepID=UPI00369D5F6E